MKKIIQKISRFHKNWKLRREFNRCIAEAKAVVARKKNEYPGCDDAMAMAWPTTGASGNGNAATGQYVANGTATTILWGTNNFAVITGWLTITKISQKTIVAFETPLENGDGLTAGLVQGIDGFNYDLEVRDDTNQNTTQLTVGQRLVLQDAAGLVPGGARGATYSCIITDHGWDTAPKTAAGRTLTVKKFILVA